MPIALSACGCSLSFWRNHADAQTYRLLQQKAAHPLWDVPRLSVQPDPRSRFFDPYCPDHEPLPPDDPAAHRYMHCVAGMHGGWHDLGGALAIENPHWLEPFGLTPEMLYPERPKHAVATAAHVTPQPLPALEDLSLDEVIELANIHNRDYQTAIEEVYLSALALTFERFRFDVRFLGFGGEPSADLTYANVPGGSDTLALGSSFGVSRLLPTGGQWIVELANNSIWLFSGDNQSTTASVLSYSLVQPLLRGAGRKVALEDLTQAERNVLYAVRDLARFRKIFFTNIVAGGPGGGFLGALQRRQQILNQQDNIEALELQVERLRALASQKPEVMFEPLDALPPGLMIPQPLAEPLRYDPLRRLLAWRGPMTDEQAELLARVSNDPDFTRAATELIQRVQSEVVTLDVAQLETQLATSRQRLFSLEAAYADNLDSYKIFLGLPPDMPITLDEELLEQFQLIDSDLAEIEDRVVAFIEVWAELNDEAPEIEPLRAAIEQMSELAEQVLAAGLQRVEGDFRRVEAIAPRRLEALDAARREQVLANLERDRRLFRDSRTRFEAIQQQIADMRALAADDTLTRDQQQDLIVQLAVLREDLLRVTQSLSVVQIGLRTELIPLEEFELSLEEATELALQNRLDLMNQRALVMDARRKIVLAANALQGVVNVVVEGDVRTPVGNNPLDFRGAESEFRTGLQLTAPLDQIEERNLYRAALIEYQQARRDYLLVEDQVKLDVRQAWRQLQVLRENFEIARQAVRFAALQLDQAVEESAAPVQPGQQQFGGRQGLNLLQALSSILRAQDNLIEIWVAYERNRLNVYRDMGIMEIDARGVWVDPLYQPLCGEAKREGGRPAPTRPVPAPEAVPAPPADAPVTRAAYSPPAKTSSDESEHAASLDFRRAVSHRFRRTGLAQPPQRAKLDAGPSSPPRPGSSPPRPVPHQRHRTRPSR